MSGRSLLISEYRAGRLSPAAQQTWAAIQDRLATYLNALIILTFIYVIFNNLIPMLGGESHGSQVFAGQKTLNFVILWVHVATAIPPLLIGPFAFSKRARSYSMRVHRWIGTTYCVSIWISAVTGFMLATANAAGIGAQSGFGVLAIVWFTTTYLAYTTARKKDFVAHRVWMIRSFAITLAVVTVRPILFAPAVIEVDPVFWKIFASWACWVPNAILGEIYLRRTTFAGKLMPPKPAEPQATSAAA